MVRNYISLVSYIAEIPKILSEIKVSLKNNAKMAEKYTKKVSKRTIAQDYSMADQLEAIRIATLNHEIITRAPKERKTLKKISSRTLRSIQTAFQASQYPPHSDLIISRGLQAQAEGLTKPKSIIQKFWPKVE